MTMKQWVVSLAVVLAVVWCGTEPLAQDTNAFSARLSWVPISGVDRENVKGRGSATATLSGSTLTISGSFEGLAAPATVARLHEGVATGARGPAIADLTITKAVKGTISGKVELTAAQLQSLRDGKLYVQVHSEKGVADDNSTLWGWFLR